MSRRVTPYLAAALMFVVQSSYAQTYRTITGSEAREILASVGMAPDSPGETSSGNIRIRFENGNGNSNLYLTGCNAAKRCERIQLVSGYSISNKPSFSKINEWNRDKILSRAYTDSEGDPFLQADLDLDGGVNRDAIVEFLKTYRTSVRSFIKHINFN